jgi:hypothetical protein
MLSRQKLGARGRKAGLSNMVVGHVKLLFDQNLLNASYTPACHEIPGRKVSRESEEEGKIGHQYITPSHNKSDFSMTGIVL